MATKGIKIVGTQAVIQNLDRIEMKALGNVTKAIVTGQALVANDAKQNHPGKGSPADSGANRMQDPETGTPRYADQTAQLTQSIKPGELRDTMTGKDGQVLAGGTEAVEYAAFVEFGTSRMIAYPFMRPALVHQQDEILRLQGKLLKQ